MVNWGVQPRRGNQGKKKRPRGVLGFRSAIAGCELPRQERSAAGARYFVRDFFDLADQLQAASVLDVDAEGQ